MVDKKLKIILAALSILGSAQAYQFDDAAIEDDPFDMIADADMGFDGNMRAEQQVDPIEILDILTCSDFKILLQNRLQEDLYLRTNPLNERSILDMPQFLVHLGCLPDDWQFNMWYFFNQMGSANFTANSDMISSYLNINSSNIFSGLEDILESFNINVSIPTTQELLGQFNVQDRRAGFMFDFFKAIHNWTLEWKMPLIYMERNFFITDQIKRRLLALFELSDDMDLMSAIKLVTYDQIGFGDMRLNLGYLAVDNNWMAVQVGALCTLPTAFAFAKGMLGTNFRQDSAVPSLDILRLAQEGMCDGQTQAVIDQTVDYAFGVFNKLAATLLNTSLGNNGHVGLGGFVEQHMTLNPRFMFKNRAALEYLFPSNETRSFITRKDGLFNAQEPFCEVDTEQEAIEKLDFLNEQLILTTVPRFVDVSIYPGFIFKFQTSLMGNFGKTWEFGVGYDMWWKSQERFGRIKASPGFVHSLRTDIARASMAVQNKGFGVVNWRPLPASERNWCWTLYGDYTFLSSGIGKDFNISLHMSFDF